MTATDTTTVQEDWTYMGQRMGADRKVIHAWLDADGETRYYGGKNITRAGVGAVYSLHVDRTGDNTSVVTGGVNAPRYVGMSDNDQTAQWQLDDEITRARIEADRAARRSKAEKPLGTMTLDELTFQYQHLATADQRAGMLAIVIKYLERGR